MKLIKFLHKWLSLLVALQLLIWLGSGMFFNLMDHNKASGNKYRIKEAEVNQVKHDRLLGLDELIKQQNRPVNSIKQITLLDQPYYLLNHYKGLYKHFYNEHSLMNAYTGENIVIDEDMAGLIARSTYSGNSNISSTIKLSPPIDDFLKEKNSVWQVNFQDDLNTSVYIDTNSGRLVGHSNDDKRFADFFFMLHFMDYPFLGKGSVGGFNNGQIIFFALLTLLFSLTGFVWIIELLRKGRYRLS